MSWYYLDVLSLLKQYIRSFFNPRTTTTTLQESAVAGEIVTSIRGEKNQQLASPLFNRIPPEIRNYIFELALTSFNDKTRPYMKGAYYYRPDYRYAQKIDTMLLQTCWRIFLETENVPASINENERELDDLLVAPHVASADVLMDEDVDEDQAPDPDILKFTENQSAEAGTTELTPKTPSKSSTAKERLVADGVKFIDEHLEPRLPEEEAQTYYVVSLTWSAC